MSELLSPALLWSWVAATFAAGLAVQLVGLVALLVLALRGLARAVRRRAAAEEEHGYAGFDVDELRPVWPTDPRGH